MALHAAVEHDAAGREIAPFEAIACERLTDGIRCFLRGDCESEETPSSPTVLRPASLESAIHHAANTIRYNAKWFEPSALATLILVALQAVLFSSSSADLYAALLLLDTVATYSILPASILLTVSRFLAYTYYQGTRANRHRKLTKGAWEIALHILQSHLGEQFIGALLEIVREDLDVFSGKMGFAYTTGALLLISEHLLSRTDGIPSVKPAALLTSLRDTSNAHDKLVQEHILRILAVAIEEDEKLRELDDSAVLDTLLHIIENCIATPDNRVIAQPILDSLKRWIPHMESRHLRALAWVYVLTDRPLEPILQREAIVGWRNILQEPKWTKQHATILTKLCASPLYLDELASMVNKSLEVFVQSDDSTALKDMLDYYRDVLSAPSTGPPAGSVISKEMVRVFEDCTQGAVPYWKQVLFFDTMCAIANRSSKAAKMLFRLRADVRGTIYFTTKAESTSGTSTTMSPNQQYDAWPLPVEKWHDVVLQVMRDGAETWKAYEVYLTRLPALLANHKTFEGKTHIVKGLLDAICGHLERGTYQQPPPSSGLGRSYVVVHLIRILTTMTSYHRFLEKKDIVRTISLFNTTAGSGDHVVSKNCIHAMTVCCAEMPNIMSSYMDDVIDKMSKMITQRFLAIHVLQFLAGLSRLPDLHRNFTQYDYKKIFGVCFSYLHSTRGQKTSLERKQTPTSEGSSTTHGEEALPEYVYALAHHLITFWYMELRQQDREGLKPYITSSLTYKDGTGLEMIEDQGLVTIDMMDRVDAENEHDEWSAQAADVVERTQDSMKDAFGSIDGRLVESHRLFGLLLVSTKTSLRTGRTLVTVRRPSGTSQRLIAKERASITRESDEHSYIPVVPTDPHGNTYGTIDVPKQSSALASSKLITLPEDAAIDRAIQAFDRTSALDSHKAGVIYIGERQTTEERILHNISGSPDYREFLGDLGTLEKLQGATFNTQGLDRSDNIDGTHTFVWHGRVTEMVFHITSMMPNSDDLREEVARKKRHIGNDHVNIVFNNSGTPLDFGALYNLFPGQFTHVYIVITPSARTSFVEARTENINVDKRDRFYGVQVVARPDYPNMAPAAEEKVVSGACLADFVRNLALNECIISLMWTSRNESTDYPSSWRSRLHQLRRLGDRYGGQK
jgi:hypothetical protein